MVIVNCVDMPVSCEECPFRRQAYHETFSELVACPFTGDKASETARADSCPLSEPASDVKVDSIAIFDHEEIHENCTVQILSNSVTGEVSVGWWHGSKEDMLGDESEE